MNLIRRSIISVAAIASLFLAAGPSMAQATGSPAPEPTAIPAPSSSASPTATNTRGDFNGDGYADLAVGVPGEDVTSAGDDGGVNVLYGTSTGIAAPGNQFWSGHQFPRVTSSGHDLFGYAVTVGDFNGDGFSDMAVGAPYHDVGSINDAGNVGVLYGSPSGLS